MKTMKFMLFAVAAMAAAACAKEVAPEVSAPAEVNYVEMEFSSALETTKTALNGSSVSWVGNETLSILDNSASPVNTKATTVSGAPGTFKATVPEATEYYAAYPYRSNIALSGSKLTNWYLAQVQTPYVGSFDKTRAPMIAKADANNVLAFRNIASHVRVTIPADMTDVMAITLMGNEDELITGIYDVDWNNGDPTYSFPKLAEAYPYVTLRKGDKTPIAPGQYYLTILPVEFKKGFTLIFAKTDGTQVAVRTDKPVTTVSKRNQIQPMKEAPSSAFKSHMNYFVHYDNGFDLDISGFVINSKWGEDNKKKVIIVTDTKENGNMATNNSCLYFVSQNCTTARLGSSTTWRDLFAIGMDASMRSSAKLGAHQNVANGATYYVLANLDFTYTSPSSKHLFIRGDVRSLGDVVISNCAFHDIPASPFNFDLGHKVANPNFDPTKPEDSKNNPKEITEHYPATIKSFIVEDSEFGFNMTTDAFLLRENSHGDSTFEKIKIHNNIFYSVATMQATSRHRILYLGNSGEVGSSVGEIIMTNNTFSNLQFKAQGNSVRNIKDGKFDCSNNLFNITLTANSDFWSMPGRNGTGGYKPTDVRVENNCYYVASGASYAFDIRSWSNENDVIFPLASDPLSDLWEPANGKFGAYTIVPAEGAAAPTGLVGAQRPDMDPVTAAVNSAAYGYETNDLGKL